MSEKVIIVESPTKCKTIAGYLNGTNDLYTVLSSKGHIRDLSTKGKDGLGLDIENNFAPNYVILKGKDALVAQLKKAVKDKDVLIATDPDREGEAIGWHLVDELGLDKNKTKRVVFREITKNAILNGIDNSRLIDMDLVKSQETRRIIDRIIGFKLSKLLRSKLGSKSAGRVQSVALKLIVDLEKEISEFVPLEYYEVIAKFAEFSALYDIVPKKKRLDKESAIKIVDESKNPFVVTDIVIKKSKRKAKPCFITSTLQQEAIISFNMSGSHVMKIAQSLYEGKEINKERVGLITYMRTDSTRISNEFSQSLRKHIVEQFGEQYLGYYKESKKDNSQDAHEAIRPTDLKLSPQVVEEYLTKDEYKIYKKIYDRAVASMMADALFDITEVTLTSAKHNYVVEGQKSTFLGYLAATPDNTIKDKILPTMVLGDKLNAIQVEKIQKFTSPKPRYNEASLIKELESLGIGRPSTYATIIQILKIRAYVRMEDKKFHPTEQGIETSKALDLFFSNIINVDYTKDMEKTLDDIALGKASPNIISNFYYEFVPMVEHADSEMVKKTPQLTDEICPNCGNQLVVRTSKYGKFLACSGFPKCKYIKK